MRIISIKMIIIALMMMALSGCAYQLTAMPRDGGKVYHGEATYNGSSNGTISLTIEDQTYTGRWVETSSNSSTLLMTNMRGGSIFGSSIGTSILKAMLTSQNGKGLRCELSGTTDGGGGICADDAGRLFDVQFTPK